jgi:hypothetical protein
MSSARTTLMGVLRKVPAAELPKAKKAYLAKHPQASLWIDFSDFFLYRMEVKDVYWVGGFGNDHYIGFVAPEQYLKSSGMHLAVGQALPAAPAAKGQGAH